MARKKPSESRVVDKEKSVRNRAGTKNDEPRPIQIDFPMDWFQPYGRKVGSAKSAAEQKPSEPMGLTVVFDLDD